MYRPFSLNSAKSMSKNGSSRTKNVPFTIRKWCTAPGSPLAGLTRKSDSLTGWMVRLPNNRLPEVGYDFNKVSSYSLLSVPEIVSVADRVSCDSAGKNTLKS